MFPLPSVEPPTLNDFEWQFNGLTIGGNTNFGVLKVEGLNLPEVRNGDVAWPRDHGQAAGLDLYGGYDIIIDLWMKTNGESLQAAQLELAKATRVLPNEQIPLWFQLPNMPLMCVMCRPRKRPMDIDSDYAAAQIGEPSVMFHSTDPRLYLPGLEHTIDLSAPSGGKVTPTEFTVDNEGNTEMRPILIFTGPLTVPELQNGTINGEPFLRLDVPTKREERELLRLKREAKEQEKARATSGRVRQEKRLAEESRTGAAKWAETIAEEYALKIEEAKKEEETAMEPAKKEHKEHREKLEQWRTEEREYVTKEEEELVAQEKAEAKEEKAKAEEHAAKAAEYHAKRIEVEEKAFGSRAGREMFHTFVAGAREESFRKEARNYERVQAIEEAVRVEEEAAVAARVAEEKVEEEAEEAAPEVTVAEGDQLLVDLGTPHRVDYYVGGIGVGEPENVSGWITFSSTWWDILPEDNLLKFSSKDATVGGTVTVQWASANVI